MRTLVNTLRSDKQWELRTVASFLLRGKDESLKQKTQEETSCGQKAFQNRTTQAALYFICHDQRWEKVANMLKKVFFFFLTMTTWSRKLWGITSKADLLWAERPLNKRRRKTRGLLFISFVRSRETNSCKVFHCHYCGWVVRFECHLIEQLHNQKQISPVSIVNAVPICMSCLCKYLPQIHPLISTDIYTPLPRSPVLLAVQRKRNSLSPLRACCRSHCSS